MRSALAAAIARQPTPPLAGVGAPASAFAATVLTTAPLRVQAQGVNVPATALLHVTGLAGSQSVLVVTVGSTHYVIGRLT